MPDVNPARHRVARFRPSDNVPMIEQLFAIIRNTFFESIRQPIMLVVLLVGAILIVLSNLLSAFTMDDDQKMFIDIGLATVFVFGALLSAMIATSVLTREIENRTALTVVSKPVSRTIYILGKYFGVAAAMLVGILMLSFVFMLVEQHQVLQTVRDPVHKPVITFGLLASVLGAVVGVWSNYFYNKAFPSTFICTTTFLLGLAYLLSLMFDPSFAWQDPSKMFRPQLWFALIVMMVATLILTAIAIAASTRFGQVMTLVITVGMFMLGLLSDWMFGAKMMHIENRWTHRVDTLPDTAPDGPSLATIRPSLDLDDLRAWNRAVLIAEAEADRRVAELELARTVENEERSRDLRSGEKDEAEPLEAFRQRIATLRDTTQSRIDDAHRAALRRIDDIIDGIDIPIERSDLARRVKQPQIFQLVSGGMSIEPDAQPELVVYPPAREFVTTAGERALHTTLATGYAVLPNFQVMLLSDAVTQSHAIPGRYVASTLAYGAVQIVLYLALGIMLFQNREVG